MRVIAIDPGVMTGFCYGEVVDGKLQFYPIQSMDEVDDLWHRLERFQPRYIIIEDFEYRGGRNNIGLNLFPVQLIGVTHLYGLLSTHQTAVYVQKAAQGKSYYTDPILKQLNFYKRGVPHGMDATRHMLQWFMFGAGNQFIGSKRTEEFAFLTDNLTWWQS